MTVIVAARTKDKGIVLAADRQVTMGMQKAEHDQPKLWVSGSYVFGVAGSFRTAQSPVDRGPSVDRRHRYARGGSWTSARATCAAGAEKGWTRDPTYQARTGVHVRCLVRRMALA